MKNSFPLIYTKLYSGLALAVVIVLAVVIFFLQVIQKQEDGNKLVNTSMSVIDRLRNIRATLSEMRGSRRVYWITEQDDRLKLYNSGNYQLPNRIFELKQLIIENQSESQHVISLDSSLSSLLTFWGNRGKLSPELSKGLFSIITVEEEKMLDKIYSLFEIIKSEEQQLLTRRETALVKYNTQAKQLIIGGISLLIFVVLVLVNAVISTLKSRYRANKRLQESLLEMERANAVSEEKNWVFEGVTKINDEIQSADGNSNLSQDIIRSIVSYMEIPAGAIYLADEEQNKLTMTASVAVSSTAKKSFEIGVGIVGNSALWNKLSITKNIPNEYWKIESAMGETSGKGEIVCLPLWNADQLKAVIELGSLNEFTQRQLLLLEAIANMLALAIHVRQSRIKINLLLEQVNEQKESLENQHEELRQNNEELSKQTGVLMASEEELKTQEEELRQMNAELHEKNSTVENARQALEIQTQKLEATSKYKSEFLANMSHELRTPLNSVLILAKLLSDNNLNNLEPKQIEYAKIIHKSGSDLLKLINDILDLAKIEAGKVELIVEEVLVESIVMDLEQLFSVVATEKEIRFKTRIEKNAPILIHTDKQRTEQVLKNLLSNAFKFTPKGGSVTIAFENRDLFDLKRIGISVTDSGIGISKVKQQMIFEAFQQADGSTNRQYGGTGLGLSISKELAKLLGGEIEIISEEEKGSSFTLILPNELKIEPSTRTETSIEQGLYALDNVIEQEKVEDDRKDITTNDKVMLIIEDDENFATILNDFAREKGYRTIVALRGDEGLFYAKKYIPTAIILDIQLPVIDGWSLLKILKSDDKLCNIPVHIISAFDDSRLHTSGALAYIKKPIDHEGLENAFAIIGSYLNEHIKKVLIISLVHFKDESLKQLFQEKHHDTQFIQVATVEQAKEKLKSEKYACLIADIGNQISEGIHDLQLIQQELHDHSIPVIIYLDTDISPQEELKLKKVSTVIVRESPTVNSRLKDELELFLFKVTSNEALPEHKNLALALNDTSLSGKMILLVDDDMRNVFALSNALEMHHIEVITAADGKESLTKLINHPGIDLVLMDIMMPEMDGYEAIQKIRQELKMTQIPIIALTAKAMGGDREKCIVAGASDYITKPVDVQKLLSLMRVWLSN